MIKTLNVAAFKLECSTSVSVFIFKMSATILDFALNLIYAAQVVGLIIQCISF